MPSSRPRSASQPARTTDDWASPGSWSGRKPSDGQDRRADHGQLSPFGAPSGAHTTSRTLDALDLATPRASPKHASTPTHKYGTLPSLQDVSKAMKAGGNKHSLDAHALAKAVGGDAKLAANIQARMQAHQDKHDALMNKFQAKGFSALHTMPDHVMKGVNKQLSEFQPKKPSLFGSLKSKK